MSKHYATIQWQRGDQAFIDNRYSRVHSWHFDGGAGVIASAAPSVVPPPYADPTAVDPEEAFVAALSSCHMLFFLSFAAKAGYCVDRYEDPAVGVMGKDCDGRIAMTEVTLHPSVSFDGPAPDAEALAALHHQAHEHCFIANSVKTRVQVAAQG